MQKIRNVAIIAHVDHGKTTLVDKMLLAGHLFRDNEATGELIMDNNELERERGITILAKNVSIDYNGYKINIIDTPGHADFGGEVERVLNMADGVLLLVDAFEGPMPQTRFVLQKALQLGLQPIVVVNKVDKPNCRPDEVNEAVFDLMYNLDATEEQLNFHTLYGSAKQNWMSEDWRKPTDNILPLLDAIIQYIPEPEYLEGTPQMLITSLDYSPYVGRIAVGRVHRGTLREGMDVSLVKRDHSVVKTRIKELHTFTGLGRTRTPEVKSGDICALVGIDGFEIGDTIADAQNPEPLKPIAIDDSVPDPSICHPGPCVSHNQTISLRRHSFNKNPRHTPRTIIHRSLVPCVIASFLTASGHTEACTSPICALWRRNMQSLDCPMPPPIVWGNSPAMRRLCQ